MDKYMILGRTSTTEYWEYHTRTNWYVLALCSLLYASMKYNVVEYYGGG